MKELNGLKLENISGGGVCYLVGLMGFGLFAASFTYGYYVGSGGRSVHLDCWNGVLE